MKKQIMFLVIGLGLVAFSASGFAEISFNKGQGTKTLNGTIVAVNTSKNVAVLRDNEQMRDHTVQVYSDQMGSLKEGQQVTAVSFGQGPFFLK